MKIHHLLLAGCIALATVARGQNDADPAKTAPAPTNAPAADPKAADAKPAEPKVVLPENGVLPASGLATNAAGRVDVSGTNDVVSLIIIDDVPLLDAVKNLARQAGLNYLPDPKLSTITNQPNVTLRLERVTAMDALTAVLDTYGLQIIKDPRIQVSRITIKDPKAADPLFSKIVQLKHTNPSNVVDVLRRTIAPPGQVMGDVRTSQLIVVATEKEFPALEELITKLDAPTKEVLIESTIWETSINPKTAKGVDWAGTLSGQNISYGNGKLNQAGSSITTTLPGTPTTVSTPGGGTTTTTPGSTTVQNLQYIPGNGITLDTLRGLHPGTAFLNADGVNVVASFFNTDNDTEVVAKPRAVTLDNQQATLSVTRAFPIFKITPGSANSPAGAEVTYTNLGTILYVTPHIAANSNITLTVIPEVSDVAAKDSQIVNGFQNTANIYAIRRMETHVMIPSGNTLVLGGLISDRVGNTMSKVPILGDTPFLGALFRQQTKEREKTILTVFVTPTIVGDDDFQIASTSSDFLQTKFRERPEGKESFMDSAKPYDWTKPDTGNPPPSASNPAFTPRVGK